MDEYKIKLCGHIGEQRQYKAVGNPDMPDGDYVLLSEAQAEIDELVDMLGYYIIFARRLKKEDEPWSDRENERELKAMRITNEHRGE